MKKTLVLALVLSCVLPAVIAVSAAIGEESAKKVLKVNGAGMASDQVDKWAALFMEKTPDVSVTVIGSSAGKGFQSLLEGSADVAMMSRAVTPDERKKASEKDLQVAERSIGQAAIALITNRRNPVSELTLDQVKKLYTGEFDNWKMVGGPDEPVRCLSRRTPESGGAVFFQQKAMGGEPFGPKVVFMESWDGMIKVCSVAEDLPIAIVPATRNLDEVKVLRIKRDEPSPAVAPSQETVKSRAYPITLPFTFVWDAGTKESAVQKFVDFCQIQGGGK